MKSDRWIALLRGVNVGGKNKLPMKQLVEVFQNAGCQHVKTYIQSGNVVFMAAEKVAAKMGGVVQAEIQQRWGFECKVVLRSQAELAKVLTKNPYLKNAKYGRKKSAESAEGEGASRATDEPKEMHYVMFLADEPAAAKVEKLDPMRSPPDTFEVIGREIYLFLPNGAARSKLTNAYFDSKLGTVSTARNWRTVLTLAEMAEELGGE